MNSRFSLLACLLLSLCFASFSHSTEPVWTIANARCGSDHHAYISDWCAGNKAAFPNRFYKVAGPFACAFGQEETRCLYTTANPCGEGNTYNYPDGSCAVTPKTPEECNEMGQAEDNGACVDTCPNGELNGQCLNPPEAPQDPENCTPESADYATTVQGIHVCGSCSGDSAFGFVNGSPQCVPSGSKDNCAAGTIQVISEGFVCATPDGEGNLTKEDGDPINEAGEQVEYADKGQSTTTTEENTTTNPDGSTTTTASSTTVNKYDSKTEKNTREMVENQEKTNKLLDDIAASNREIADTLAGEDPDAEPEAPIDYDKSAPTIAESSTAFMNRINNAPIVAAFSTAPTIAENNSCPVFGGTVPILGELVFDIHCDVFAQHGGSLSAIFIAMWTLAAGLVFLRS